ncbi:myb-like protein A [Panonychus citri]|uniref:myb-like protein A n=1 Tax=Panonychus citri TaxID=50023 RepID=UPI0023075136|nr:myb-like protein A [Panonychus citri]
MSIFLNSTTMRSLVNSIILGEPSNNNYIHQHNHQNHHQDNFFHHHNHIHSKQNSFSSSSEIMSTITESSNSSIDSGTFDVFDDPEDHFYDEPLLSTFDYHFLDNSNQNRNPSTSSSSSNVTNISSHGSSSVIESLLLESCNNNNNYKSLDNNSENTKHSHNQTSSIGKITINKPKIRPPKPPRHINPLTGKKLINQSVSTDLPLTLPPKGACSSSSSSSSSSGVSSTGSLSPSPSFKLCEESTNSSPHLPPPLQPQSVSKKPDRPPPPVPDHPPKPLRKKSEIKTITSSNQAPIETQSTMAVLNRSRSSQGSFYETAFDSKAILHDGLHRDQINQLSQHNLQPIKMTYHSNHHPNHNHHHNHHTNNFHRSTENSNSSSSVASFINDNNINSSRSSTASSTSSSNGHESSSSSTPKHLDQLAGSLLPRRQPIKSTVHIPRSKSSDITLNLSAALNPPSLSSSSSSPSPPSNQTDKISSSIECKSANIITNHLSGDNQSAKRNQVNTKTLSTFSMVKSTTSDSLSSFDCEAGRVLTRTRSNLDSLRLSIQDRNNRVNILSSSPSSSSSSSTSTTTTATTTTTSSNDAFNSLVKSNNNHCNQKIVATTNKMTDKLPANRSFRRLNLKLDETRSSMNLSSPKLQSPLTDTRPLDDYDTPWDSNQRLNKVFNKLINTPSEKDESDCFPNVNSLQIKTPSTESNLNNLTISSFVTTCNQVNLQRDCIDKSEETIVIGGNDNVSSSRADEQSTNQLQLNEQRKGSVGSTNSSNSSVTISGDLESNGCINSCASSPIEPVKMDSKPERPRKLSLPLNLKNGNDSTSAKRVDLNLNLDFSNVPTVDSSANSSPVPTITPKLCLGPRKKPLLTFTGQPLPVVSEDIDTTLILEKQGWYHGSITRLDAENLLRKMKEGSYLIRNCESTKQDYSLSLKSVKGFMHMKIVKQSDGFVLGVFSKPFENIPEMVKHYSINKLPIRGAEHMSLLYPVIDQLL